MPDSTEAPSAGAPGAGVPQCAESPWAEAPNSSAESSGDVAQTSQYDYYEYFPDDPVPEACTKSLSFPCPQTGQRDFYRLGRRTIQR